MSSVTTTTSTAHGTARRRLRRHRGVVAPGRHPRSSRTAQPLHEALAVGLGCTSVGYRLRPQPEWR